MSFCFSNIRRFISIAIFPGLVFAGSARFDRNISEAKVKLQQISKQRILKSLSKVPTEMSAIDLKAKKKKRVKGSFEINDWYFQGDEGTLSPALLLDLSNLNFEKGRVLRFDMEHVLLGSVKFGHSMAMVYFYDQTMSPLKQELNVHHHPLHEGGSPWSLKARYESSYFFEVPNQAYRALIVVHNLAPLGTYLDKTYLENDSYYVNLGIPMGLLANALTPRYKYFAYPFGNYKLKVEKFTNFRQK